MRLLSSDHAAMLRDGEWAPALPVRELVPGHGGGFRALLLRPHRVLESGGAADGGGRLRRRHLLRPARPTPDAHFPGVVAVVRNHRHRAPTLSPSLQAPTFSQSPHPSLLWPVDSPLAGSIPPSQRSAGPDGSGTALIGASVATVLRVEADPQRRWRCVKPARASARGTTWLSGDEMLVHLLLTDQIAEDSSSTDAPKERISNATIAAQHSRRARAGLLNPTALLGRFMSQAAAEGEIQVERAISIAATRPPVCVSPPLL